VQSEDRSEADGQQRRWYRNLPLVAGLLLILLGLGNWVTGAVRTVEHQERIAAALDPSRARETPPKRASAEEIEIARVRMDFYHVVASGGRVMTAAGLLLATIGLARSLRWQARRG
jgi:hypothetical protein